MSIDNGAGHRAPRTTDDSMMNEDDTTPAPEVDCNAHCQCCPGTGWLWDNRKCFNQYHRVRPCPVPDDTARQPGPRALRPPMRPPDPVVYEPEPEPEPAPVAAQPAPPAMPAPVEPPFDIHSIMSVAAFARKGFRAGRGLYTIARDLTALGVPVPHDGEWHAWDIKRLLLDNPRPAPARPKRTKAAA